MCGFLAFSLVAIFQFQAIFPRNNYFVHHNTNDAYACIHGGVRVTVLECTVDKENWFARVKGVTHPQQNRPHLKPDKTVRVIRDI